MLPAEIEKPLSLIELQCEAVAAAVTSGEPQALEAASHALKQAAVDFAAFMEQRGASELAGTELRARLKKLATQLTIQRENLFRRTVVVERAVHTLVPDLRKSTYGPGGSAAAGRAASYKAFAA